jgi:ribosomal protein S18 acetylase RimI-like enzyme
MVTIRRAEKRDLEAVGRLGAALIETHYAFDRQRFLAPQPGTAEGYAWFLETVIESDDAAVFVAEEGQRVIGYTYVALEPLSWNELRGPAGFIHDIVVDEPARRAGIGTKLMQTGVEWLRERGAPRIILWTAAPNAGAQKLFRALGFRDTMIEMTMEAGE